MTQHAGGAPGDSGAVRVSIIVPTRNRAGKLARCLEHVVAIHSQESWELIVVDNGSTDETLDVLNGLAQLSALRLRVVSEPVPGGARTRNAGAKIAGGDILIFIDDDCYVRPDIVDRYCEVFADPAIGFAGGRILLHDRTDYPLTINESEAEVRFPAARPVPCGIVQSGNMAVRRQALLDAGGFDERMGPATRFPAEDWDIQTRMGIRGWAGGYFPGPTVSHHHGRKGADARKRIRAYNIGSGAVYLKLIADRATRRTYLPHILRRMLGDMKFHQFKVATQIYGAMLFFRQNRRHLLALHDRAAYSVERSGSA
jgi:glycosyltransferase involved in cell wall biosynthesis